MLYDENVYLAALVKHNSLLVAATKAETSVRNTCAGGGEFSREETIFYLTALPRKLLASSFSFEVRSGTVSCRFFCACSRSILSQYWYSLRASAISFCWL